MVSNTSSGDETNRSVAPLTDGTRFLSSCTERLTLDTAGEGEDDEGVDEKGLSKSVI